jgi:hypothetical protein
MTTGLASGREGLASPARSGAASDRRLGTGLVVVPAACLLALGTMGLVFASGPPPRLQGHLDAFADGQVLYRWGFVGASLIAPTFAATLVLLLAAVRVPADSVRRWVAALMLAGYLSLSTIAYASQYTFLPGLVERDPETAALWYLHDASSIPYALDLTGYAFLALAAILVASTLVDHGGRQRAIAWCLALMGVLSLAALGFHAGGLATSASVATAVSGAFTLPILVLAMLQGRALRRAAEGQTG